VRSRASTPDERDANVRTLLLGSVGHGNSWDELIMLDVTVNGVNCKALVDSGSGKSFIDTTLASKNDMPRAQKLTPDRVKLADGSLQPSTEILPAAQLRCANYAEEVTLHATPLHGFGVILGKDWLSRHQPRIDWKRNIVRFTHKGKKHALQGPSRRQALVAPAISHMLLTVTQLKKELTDEDKGFICHLKTESKDQESHTACDLREVIEEFRDVFPAELPGGLPPERDIEHAIELEPGANKPRKNSYRMTEEELAELRRQLDELLSKGHIRPSTSPYGAPILFIKKKSGEMRLCVDYRMLNKVTIKDSYPLPVAEDLMDRLHGMKCATKLDLRSGYHQILIKAEHRERTAFVTRYGTYEWTVMPFGLCNAPATFQRLMNTIFRDLLDRCVIVYLDDILIYSKNPEEHKQHVREVLEILRKHKLYAKESKCVFGVDRLEFLGHIVGKDGIRMDPEKVAAIREWPTPTSVHDVRSFVGLASYYRRFVRDFASIAAPLTSLMTKKYEGRKLPWGEKETEAFETLKETMCSAPVLASAAPGGNYTLYTDASSVGLGAVLHQKQEGVDRVIAFHSRKLNGAELKYSVHDKELLAVVEATRKWRHYLGGYKFDLYTDNKANTYIQTQPHLDPKRQARFMEKLQAFDFTVHHVEGKCNVVADALSRRSDYALGAMAMVGADSSFLEKLAAESAQDAEYQEFAEAVRAGKRPELHLKDGLLYQTREIEGQTVHRLYLPKGTVRGDVLHSAHDAPTAGHLGRDKTLERLERHYFWPRMSADVHEYVKTCPSCQKCKSSNAKPAGLLKPLPVPKRNWDQISMDLITQLPVCKETSYDALVVFVDRLSKMVRLAPTTTSVTAEQLARVFMDSVFRHHGMPRAIVSDRDPKFTSDFWRAVFTLTGTLRSVLQLRKTVYAGNRFVLSRV
jgi:hypothetical protein